MDICATVPGNSYINVCDNCTYWKLHPWEYDTSYNEHTLSSWYVQRWGGGGREPIKIIFILFSIDSNTYWMYSNKLCTASDLFMWITIYY